MNSTGNKPPASVPAKASYLQKELERNSKYFGIPLSPPSNFPPNTMQAQRLLTVIDIEAPHYLVIVTRNLWVRLWVKGQGIETPENLLKCCTEVGVPEAVAKKWLDRLKDQDIKDKLKSVTDEAISKGAFGAPTFFIKEQNSDHEEMFFGSDRFELIAYCYGLPWDGPQPGQPKAKY